MVMAGRVQSVPLKHASRSTAGRASDKAAGSSASKGEAVDLTSTDNPSGFSFSEVQGDLFSCPDSSSLAHCVSEDLAMGKGVATLFKKKFGGVSELKAQGVQTGGVAVLQKDGKFIYYLITKLRYFHKPTYDTLHASLLAMKEHCVANKVHDLCMPRIGCGLDRLDWDKVVKMIEDVFKDVNIKVTVYYL